MPKKGEKKSHCKRGHLRTPDNLNKIGACILCIQSQRATHLEKSRETARQRRAKYPERVRAVGIARKCSIDKEIVYQYLFERRDVFVCDICQQECPTGRSLALDHDHNTNEIRGLLCVNCNRALGLFKDSIKFVERAAEYLRNNNCER